MPGKKRSNSTKKTQSRKTRTVSMTKQVAVKPLAPSQKASTLDLVRNYIQRYAETHYRGMSVVKAQFNGSIASAAEIYQCLPSIPKNTTDSITAYGRLGDKIKPLSLQVWGSIALSTAQYRRVRVRVMFLTAKSIKNAAQKSNIDIVHLINDGQTDGGVQFDGTVERRDFPVNTNKFTVLSDRSYNLFQAGSVSVGGPDPLPGPGETFPTFNNYDDNISSAKHFKLRLPVPSLLQYSASTGNDPTNYYPFVVIGYTNLDGNAAPTSTPTEITACISSMLKYDDA